LHKAYCQFVLQRTFLKFWLIGSFDGLHNFFQNYVFPFKDCQLIMMSRFSYPSFEEREQNPETCVSPSKQSISQWLREWVRIYFMQLRYKLLAKSHHKLETNAWRSFALHPQVTLHYTQTFLRTTAFENFVWKIFFKGCSAKERQGVVQRNILKFHTVQRSQNPTRS
jgi:hypothetical protein